MPDDEKPLPFQSWIGAHFHETRFMLLAESTYTWIEDGIEYVPGLGHSTEIVEHVIKNPEQASRSMVTITRALCNNANPTLEQRQTAWAAVAFNNFVPGSVGIGARRRPSPEAWAHAQVSFLATLPQPRPTRLLVLGRANWNHLPWEHWDQASMSYILHDGTQILTSPVAHPAAIGMSWSKLHDAIKQLRDRPFPAPR